MSATMAAILALQINRLDYFGRHFVRQLKLGKIRESFAFKGLPTPLGCVWCVASTVKDHPPKTRLENPSMTHLRT